MSHSRLLTAAAAALLSTPLSALAHEGHGPSVLVAFFVHPFSGLDHLAAIVAIAALAGLALASLALFVLGRSVGRLVAQLPRVQAR
ncbi:MAG: HupE/UreJ family protein [Burkholderiales bacterium]